MVIDLGLLDAPQAEPCGDHGIERGPSAPAVFRNAYARSEAEALRTASTIALHLATTGPSSASPPARLRKQARIGQRWTRAEYAAHLGEAVSVDPRPRARVLALETGDGWQAAWDLDALDASECANLFADVFSAPVLIGHDLAFALNWAAGYTAARPKRLIDTMLVLRVLRPRRVLNVHIHAAELPAEHPIQGMIRRNSGKTAGASLAACAAAVGECWPEPGFPAYEDWTLAPLSPEHLQEGLEQARLAGRVALKLLDAELFDPHELVQRVDADRNAALYHVFERATLELAEMHRRGMPFDVRRAKALIKRERREVPEAVGALVKEAPDLADWAQALHTESSGEPTALKEALDACLYRRIGRGLPRSSSGEPVTGASALRREQLGTDRVVQEYLRLRAAKQRLETAERLMAYAEHDGRIRSRFSLDSETGRMASKAPNVQSLPADSAFLGLVAASAGHEILTLDYAAIDMRIAAALAARTHEHIEAVARGEAQMPEGAAWLGLDLRPEREAPRRVPERPDREAGFEAWRAYYAAVIESGLACVRAEGHRLRDAFHYGADVHLVTAIALQSYAGALDLGGEDPLAYVLNRDQGRLKQEHADARQRAKAANFGLLFGMSLDSFYAYGIGSCGLEWTREEAAAARAAWFATYPEIALWQAWTRHADALPRRRRPRGVFRDPSTGETEVREQRIWMPSSLSGCTLVATRYTDALAFPTQCSGAEMLLDAIGRLSPQAKACLVGAVHDELLLEVASHRVDKVSADAQAAMLEAAQARLDPYGVPAELEIHHGVDAGRTERIPLVHDRYDRRVVAESHAVDHAGDGAWSLADVAEAAEERAAIVAESTGEGAEAVARTARRFYAHAFGVERNAGCAGEPFGHCCDDGARLRGECEAAVASYDAPTPEPNKTGQGLDKGQA